MSACTEPGKVGGEFTGCPSSGGGDPSSGGGDPSSGGDSSAQAVSRSRFARFSFFFALLSFFSAFFFSLALSAFLTARFALLFFLFAFFTACWASRHSSLSTLTDAGGVEIAADDISAWVALVLVAGAPTAGDTQIIWPAQATKSSANSRRTVQCTLMPDVVPFVILFPFVSRQANTTTGF